MLRHLSDLREADVLREFERNDLLAICVHGYLRPRYAQTKLNQVRPESASEPQYRN